MLGMEIRTKVSDYVAQRILALRAKAKEEGKVAYENVAVVRGNAMKYMANFFEKGQVGGDKRGLQHARRSRWGDKLTCPLSHLHFS